MFGFFTVVADGVPSSAFSPGEWVEPVVGDDVEAVLALHDVAHPPVSTTSTPTRSSAVGARRERAVRFGDRADDANASGSPN